MPPRRASHLPPAQPIYRRLWNGAALLLHRFPTLTGYTPKWVLSAAGEQCPLTSVPSWPRSCKANQLCKSLPELTWLDSNNDQAIYIISAFASIIFSCQGLQKIQNITAACSRKGILCWNDEWDLILETSHDEITNITIAADYGASNPIQKQLNVFIPNRKESYKHFGIK